MSAFEDVGGGARERFVHALLEREFGAERERDEERLRAAFAALGKQELAPGARLVQQARPRAARFVALAAVALAVVSALLTVSRPTSAAGVLAQVTEAARAAVDRTYRMRLVPRRPLGVEREAELVVRGSERLQVRFRSGPLAGLRAGLDGGQAWILPAPETLPVVVLDGPERLQARLRERGADLPFLSLAAALERLAEFELDFEERGAETTRLVATAPPRPEDPQRVELVVDTASGTLRSFEATWSPRSDPRRPLARVSIVLVEERPRPDAFYGHAAHHDGRRTITRD